MKLAPDFPFLADEIAESHQDMNIKVAAFTVSEKSCIIYDNDKYVKVSKGAKIILYVLDEVSYISYLVTVNDLTRVQRKILCLWNRFCNHHTGNPSIHGVVFQSSSFQ